MTSLPSTHRRADIQGLRAIAVLLVIADHAHLGLLGGFIGVDVFFVISGFVITGMLLREGDAHGTIRLGRFFIRRGYRLIPAAALVLTFTAVVGMFILSPLGTQQQSAVTGGAAAVGLSNIALYAISSDYFSEHVQANPFLHTWSLGVEEQFYLFFPLVLLIVWKVARHRLRAAVWTLTIIAAASFALSTITSYSAILPVIKNPPVFAFYMMPTRAWEFAAGALLACGAVALARFRGHLAATIIGLLLIAVSAVTVKSTMAFPGFAAVLPVAGTALVIFGGLRPNRASRTLGSPALTHLGDLSYSLYLWHWPLLVFARRLWPDNGIAIVGALLLTYAAAWATYRYIETPWRERRVPTITRRSLLMPAAAVTIALVATGSMFVGSRANWWNPNVEAAAVLLERPVGYGECLSTTRISERNLTPCEWPGSGEPIYLLGDSNAQQFTEAAVDAAAELDRPLTVATWGGCPFFDVQISDPYDLSQRDECALYANDGMSWIAEQPRGTVIIAAASEHINDLGTEMTYDGTTATTTAAKASMWGTALADRVEEIEAAGHEVLIVGTLPHFAGEGRQWWHPVQCSNAVLFADERRCSVTVPESVMARQMAAIHQAESDAVARTGAPFLDLTREICDGECVTLRDGLWLYRDGAHISPAFSATLAPNFVKALS